jgi:hypothetical protein
MKKEKSDLEIKYTTRIDKSNDLIIRELLSNILQVLLKQQWYTQKEVELILEKIYNY